MCVFFFNDTATTEIYTLSLHDALPISILRSLRRLDHRSKRGGEVIATPGEVVKEELDHEFVRDSAGDDTRDRKSTRLNSSHANISYAVFCLKKKKKIRPHDVTCSYLRS